MPKIITPAMRAHLDEKTTRLAAIWRTMTKDGAQFFFADHNRDIVFSGDIYRADAGFERTAIRSDAGFALDNLDLVGVFAEGGIVEDEVRAGLFDGAEIRISFVNWDDPDSHGEIRLQRPHRRVPPRPSPALRRLDRDHLEQRERPWCVRSGRRRGAGRAASRHRSQTPVWSSA